MTKEKQQELDALLARADSLIAEGSALLKQKGVEYDLAEWVTMAEYVKRFGLKSTMVVTNWIKRGIIPAENIVTVPELNNIRLIKAVPYHE